MRSLYYIVEEKNAAGAIRSEFFTPNPWQALSEWLLKIHKPVGFPPQILNSGDDLSIVTEGHSVPVDHVMLESTARLIWQGKVMREISIRTEASYRPRIQSRSAGTAPYYMTDTYMSAVTSLRNRMRFFCDDQLDVGYILSHFAGKNVSHPLWMGRARA